MPLTVAEMINVFVDPMQLGVPNDTMMKLVMEGINTLEALANHDEDTMKIIVNNLRNHGERIPNPDPNAPPGTTIPRGPYQLSAQSIKRILETAELMRFYRTIGREATVENVRYDPVVMDFTEQWNALKERKKDDVPDVPKISKALPVIKWIEAFDDFLTQTFGTRTIPLSYVTREVIAPLPEDRPLELGKPHSVEYESVEGDLIALASHLHPKYRDDNAKLYYYLEEATRSTSYAASMKPLQASKNGRAAYLSIRQQYAGKDKWEAEIKTQDDLLHNRKWKGQSNFPLEKFISQHRNAYVSMVQCSSHVAFQLPNEHTRVGYLLDAIDTKDHQLSAAIANIQIDDSPNGKRNDFEATAAALLPHDPVAKKRTTKREYDSNIGATTADISATSFGDKPGIGKTGVHLRFHKTEEYRTLSPEQKAELREWRENNPKSKTKSKFAPKAPPAAKKKVMSKHKVMKSIAAMVARKIKGDDDDEEVDKKIKDAMASISAFNGNKHDDHVMDESETDSMEQRILNDSNDGGKSMNEPPKENKKVRFTPTKETKFTKSGLKSILTRVKNLKK